MTYNDKTRYLCAVQNTMLIAPALKILVRAEQTSKSSPIHHGVQLLQIILDRGPDLRKTAAPPQKNVYVEKTTRNMTEATGQSQAQNRKKNKIVVYYRSHFSERYGWTKQNAGNSRTHTDTAFAKRETSRCTSWCDSLSSNGSTSFIFICDPFTGRHVTPAKASETRSLLIGVIPYVAT